MDTPLSGHSSGRTLLSSEGYSSEGDRHSSDRDAPLRRVSSEGTLRSSEGHSSEGETGHSGVSP